MGDGRMELGAARREEAEEEAREQQLYRGLVYARASSSSAHGLAGTHESNSAAASRARGEGGRGGGSPAGELAWGAAAPTSWA